MSDAFWIAFFGSLPASLFALGALVTSIWNRRTLTQQNVAAVELKTEVVDLKHKINGQTSALIAVKEASARADGVIAGQASGKEQARVDAVGLAEAVAARLAADQLIRDEGRAAGLIRTRHDDVPNDHKKG